MIAKKARECYVFGCIGGMSYSGCLGTWWVNIRDLKEWKECLRKEEHVP